MKRSQHVHFPSHGNLQSEALDARAISTPSRQTASPHRFSKRGFLGYCGADLPFAQRLQTHLASCQGTSPLDLWDEARLPAGCHWKTELEGALASAPFAVLLVSPDFLAESFISADLLPPLLHQARDHGTRIVSVITRPCLFVESLLADFRPFNDPAKPLSALSTNDRDLLWVQLVRFLLSTQ